MKQLIARLSILLGMVVVVLLAGCAIDSLTTATESAVTSDAVTYNESSSTASDTSVQDALNSQTATDEANAAAQASYVADMAATQAAINNDSN